MDHQLEKLDARVIDVARGDFAGLATLSTGEALYVALAANRYDVLDKMGFTIVAAWSRIGEHLQKQLEARWADKRDPRQTPAAPRLATDARAAQ
jgi:hypothetical protein